MPVLRRRVPLARQSALLRSAVPDPGPWAVPWLRARGRARPAVLALCRRREAVRLAGPGYRQDRAGRNRLAGFTSSRVRPSDAQTYTLATPRGSRGVWRRSVGGLREYPNYWIELSKLLDYTVSYDQGSENLH